MVTLGLCVPELGEHSRVNPTCMGSKCWVQSRGEPAVTPKRGGEGRVTSGTSNAGLAGSLWR